ncbi:MAG: V-type ATP synthase subunit K [Firmicutes bacterium]|nr:V-type ATP synthase subunit K [Bacillota bacterium]
MDLGTVLAFAGVASAVVFSGFGSAMGVGIAGQVSAGVVAEDPGKVGKTIILTALPGTQGIYGFVIGMLIVLFKLPAFHGAVPLDAGLKFFLAGIPVGLVGLVSGIWQGKVAAAGVGMVGKRPEEASKGIVYAGMVETYAILSFVISFILVNSITP